MSYLMMCCGIRLRALGREADAVTAEQDFEKARVQRERVQG